MSVICKKSYNNTQKSRKSVSSFSNLNVVDVSFDCFHNEIKSYRFCPEMSLAFFSPILVRRSRLHFLQSACSCINFQPCMQTVILDRIRCCGEQNIWLGILYLCHRFQLTFYKWPSFLFDHCYIQSCRNILITGILF